MFELNVKQVCHDRRREKYLSKRSLIKHSFLKYWAYLQEVTDIYEIEKLA